MTLPLGSLYGTQREEPAPGRFFLRVGSACWYVCDPAAPLKQGDLVAYRVHDGTHFIGRLETKHPEKAKTLSIDTRGLPSGRIPRKDVSRCVQMVRDI